jgi:indolepyruvate ferredoxin oxidoreductase
MAKLKVLRGTVLDPFGYTEERRTERRLIADYTAMIGDVLEKLAPENHHLAVGLAAVPDKIRGFGFIKLRNLAAAKEEEASLLEQFRAASPLLRAAE